jgi:hypothetical protein
MPTTPALGFPYPASTDLVAEGFQNIEELAEAVEGALVGANYVGRYRNLLYNGAMNIAQRSGSVSGITAGGYYTVDRWGLALTSLGTWEMVRTTDATDLPGFGFRSLIRLQCTTADSSPAAGDLFVLNQRLEGLDLQHLRKGTANALPLTLSFWVRTRSGTFVAELVDVTNNRSISATYTVATTDVWQRIEITFPGDTSGVLADTNAAALHLNLWLGAGTTYTSGTLATTWGSLTNANRAVGQTNLADGTSTTTNVFRITGVQLEAGHKATPFEHKPYGEELARCQRYYFELVDLINHGVSTGVAVNTTTCRGEFTMPTAMRAVPTFVYSSAPNLRGNGSNVVTTAVTGGMAVNGINRWQALVASGLTSSELYMIYSSSAIGLDAEI